MSRYTPNSYLLLKILAVLALFILVQGSQGTPTTEVAPESLPFRNIHLPLEKRVEDLIGRLSVDEKISLLMMESPAIPRLGVPVFGWWSEGLHGVARQGIATVFPQAIALAATWNPELHHRIADVIGTEARAKNNAKWMAKEGPSSGPGFFCDHLSLWSPNINIFRDPRWGRGQETYGEDPFLTSCFGVAFVTGLQGEDPTYLKTIATVKHYAVHSGPESERHEFDAVVTERDLHETYLPAFEAGIREGHSGEVMSAYNAIDGIPAPANKRLLTDILRDTWGFRGAVVGDVDTVEDMTKGHHYTKSAAEASAVALKAGNDLCSGKTYQALPEALKLGLVQGKDLDRALRRLLALRFRLGQFDPPDRVPYAKIPASENDSPAHEKLALEAARQSLVLLKNDGVLPLDPKIKTIAVLGPTASDPGALIGNYNGSPARPVTILDGIRRKFEPLGVTVLADSAIPLVSGLSGTGNPFPEGVLFTDETRSVPGLKGEVFSSGEFSGTPTATRTDTQLNLFWAPAQPVPGIPMEGAFVRWSGVIVPKKTDDYQLVISFIGKANLFLDDKEIAGVPKSGAPGKLHSESAKVHLEAGHPYKVRLEFGQGAHDPTARIQFGWRGSGGMEEALAMAAKADRVILCLGITPNLEGEEMKVDAPGFSGGDRTSILLPDIQRDLLAKVAALKKPIIVILTNGSALSLDTSKVNALLEAWYYGEQGGTAVAETLLGENNPAGRLPVTFYASDSDLPPFRDYSMKNRTYRYFTGKPLYSFGHGLSYTTFDYGTPTLSPASINGTGEFNVTVKVTNTGKRACDEVVQVYAHAVKPPVEMPIQSLVGFQRITLQAGESKDVVIPVKAINLRRWDEQAKAYVVDPGQYEIRVGSASDHIRGTAILRVGNK